ncbi:MAG: glycerol-3-phosphate 1-O-acyltransferase PlsY [Clostridium sp.]|nr:glycerol-3-phosphate 1-O-acyltransferase PlsY [Clostridium sp.]
MIYVAYISIAIISYLLGSLNFGVILSNKLKNDDVRNHGSGNAGTTNMLRNYGKKIAVLTIIGDMLKVAIAIGIAYLIIGRTPMLLNENGEITATLYSIDTNMLIKSFAGFFCVLGHIFPCFFGFKGGKGVATAGGMVFIVDWRIALILLAVFIVVVAVTRYVSLGSIIMAVLYPVLLFLFHKSLVLSAIALVFTLVVVIAHRENVKKLIHHTENKVDFKSKKNDSCK